jgi:hypothetical protein
LMARYVTLFQETGKLLMHSKQPGCMVARLDITVRVGRYSARHGPVMARYVTLFQEPGKLLRPSTQ